jgi:antitoxin MazE
LYKHLRKVGVMTTATIRKWGNGQGVLIPKTICEQAGLAVGDKVDLLPDPSGTRIIINPETPRHRRRKKVTLNELFAGYRGDYQPTECDWGEPVGKEMW